MATVTTQPAPATFSGRLQAWQSNFKGLFARKVEQAPAQQTQATTNGTTQVAQKKHKHSRGDSLGGEMELQCFNKKVEAGNPAAQDDAEETQTSSSRASSQPL